MWFRLSRVRFPSSTPHGTVAQLVERQTENLGVAGSTPAGSTIWVSRLAAMASHCKCDGLSYVGSSPTWPTKCKPPIFPKGYLSLKNVGIKIVNENGHVLYTDFGEMMFTHFGVTGPMILSASAHLRNHDISTLLLSIDLKPALDEKTLDMRLLSDFLKNANKDLINSLSGLLPSKMIRPFIKLTGIDERKKVNAITKEERHLILTTLKDFRIPLLSFRPIEEAIITSGGIEVKEISPKTMESKILPGLYFAGEMIDVDAYTGGFNLQIAFSTGYLAGKSAAESLY